MGKKWLKMGRKAALKKLV